MNIVARALIQTKAVHLEPNKENYFTWTSGRRSPIYCDNRQLISYPLERKAIIHAFCNYIEKNHSGIQSIAGTATAGIPWAAWIAEKLNLPLIYIRSKPKGHGLKSALEGHYRPGESTLIIEDLISTGKSSLEAYHHAKKENLRVKAVLSIFNYGFPEAKLSFQNEDVQTYSLCELEDLLKYAQESKQIDQKDCQNIKSWRDSF